MDIYSGNEKHLYVCGNSRCPDNSALGGVYQNFAVELVINVNNGIILDASCILITDLGKKFVKSLLVGRNFIDEFDNIVDDIDTYYQGLPQKALISALRVALNKYKQNYNKIYEKHSTNRSRFVG